MEMALAGKFPRVEKGKPRNCLLGAWAILWSASCHGQGNSRAGAPSVVVKGTAGLVSSHLHFANVFFHPASSLVAFFTSLRRIFVLMKFSCLSAVAYTATKSPSEAVSMGQGEAQTGTQGTTPAVPEMRIGRTGVPRSRERP